MRVDGLDFLLHDAVSATECASVDAWERIDEDHRA